MAESQSQIFFSGLIRSAYFPRELPPTVTTRNLASFCRRNYRPLREDLQRLLRIPTQYDVFSAPKNVQWRRDFAVVHPIAQIALSLILTRNRKVVARQIGRSNLTLYSTSGLLDGSSDSRAFIGLQFRRRQPVEESISSRYKYVLRADISRFFDTTYTHSIPWSVLGKEKVKHWISNGDKKYRKHWLNSLDRALQCAQSRETHGIPIGPDTSRIVAEILLAGVEAETEFSNSIRDSEGYRLVDDFFIGFRSAETAHSALHHLRESLAKYNLQLNDAKTSVVRTYEVVEPEWRQAFDKLAPRPQRKWARKKDVRELLYLGLHFGRTTGDHRPAVFACRRIGQYSYKNTVFDFAIQSLVRLARDFPGCMGRVAEFIINNRNSCIEDPVRGKIANWAKECLKEGLERNLDFEASWSLVILGVLKVELHQDDFPDPPIMPRSIVMVMMGMLRERGLLNVSLDRWKWRALLKQEGMRRSYWMFLYEAVRRNWTRDKEIVQLVKGEPVFDSMMKEQVTFLEDRVFDATSIDMNLGKFRSLRRASKSGTRTAATGRGQRAGGERSTESAIQDYDDS